MKIAFLGLGQMGQAIAKLLVEKKHEVIVWNRTAAAAKPLVELGAKLAETPAEAVQTAEVVFTMLFDDQAVEEVFLHHKALNAIPANAIHISLSTISVAFAERLEAEHTAHKQRFLCAPVFGRPNVAAEGKLWLVIAGADDAIAEAKPLLESISRGHTVVGSRPSQANVVKLGGNFLIASVIASLAEAVTVVEAQAVDPELFLEILNSAIFQSAFIATYSKMMIHPPETAGATLKLGEKDTKLFSEAAHAGKTPTPLADHYHRQIEAAVEAGRGDEDWASGYLDQARTLARTLAKQP